MTATTSAELIESLALLLDELGLAQYAPPGPGVFYVEDPARPAIVLDADLPPEPPTALAISVYDDNRDRDAWNPDIYVRLRFRADGLDPGAVNTKADRVFEHIHTAEPGDRQQWPGGVNVLTCLRVVRAQSVKDANDRSMRADSYRITLNPGD